MTPCLPSWLGSATSRRSLRIGPGVGGPPDTAPARSVTASVAGFWLVDEMPAASVRAAKFEGRARMGVRAVLGFAGAREMLATGFCVQWVRREIHGGFEGTYRAARAQLWNERLDSSWRNLRIVDRGGGGGERGCVNEGAKRFEVNDAVEAGSHLLRADWLHLAGMLVALTLSL